MEVSQRRPLNDRREVDADDKWANVARNFAYQPKKDLAVDMIGQVRSLRRGSALSFPKAFQRVEQRALRGGPPSLLPERRDMRRRLSLSPAIEGMRQRVERLAHIAHERLRPRQRREMEMPDRGLHRSMGISR